MRYVQARYIIRFWLIAFQSSGGFRLDQSKKVRITEISENSTDLLLYLGWLRDAENNSFIEGVREDYELNELKAYIEEKKLSANAQLWGIYTIHNSFVGTIKLEPINLAESEAWLGIMIGSPSNRGKGYARAAIELVCQYANAVLGLSSIKLGVKKSNLSAYQLYINLGFEVDYQDYESFYMRKSLANSE
jgi:RimJ/RimL family protein N-acetyltransferase